MSPFVAEIVGTAILLLLGTGVVANVVLTGTKGNNSGWIVITAGWGMAVFVAVACVGQYSGAHINPAVTVGLALAGKFSWDLVPCYILAQMIGAILGAILAYLAYLPHYAASDDPAAKLATFSTVPAIRSLGLNTVTEIIGTFVLVITVLYFAAPNAQVSENESIAVGLGSVGAIPVGLLVFAIGLSLGGPTGYAINPARDLGPRIVHAVLPIPGKGSSDWSYAWVPIVGPLLGGAAAAGFYLFAAVNP
jgi:glycerol uptake facilitator protein